MTYTQIVALLSKSRCLSLEKNVEIDHNHQKRDATAGTLDIYALERTVNENRNIIQYLINNSINATIVAEAIDRYHNRTAPVLTSWRDLVDLLFISLVLITLIYLLIFRVGIHKCDQALVYLFRPVHNRLQQQYPEQQPPQSVPSPPIPPEQMLPNFTISPAFREAIRLHTRYTTQKLRVHSYVNLFFSI
jgi:hypothetical protein